MSKKVLAFVLTTVMAVAVAVPASAASLFSTFGNITKQDESSSQSFDTETPASEAAAEANLAE
ncbi:MAG: hypothetical protein IJ133_07455 [Clostridia bacterium]|nr:hypothetical protein [Clostridia bacterium]